MASKYHTVMRPTSFNSPWVCREELIGKHAYIWRAKAQGHLSNITAEDAPSRKLLGVEYLPEHTTCQSSSKTTYLTSHHGLRRQRWNSKRKPWANREKYVLATSTLQPPAAPSALAVASCWTDGPSALPASQSPSLWSSSESSCKDKCPQAELTLQMGAMQMPVCSAINKLLWLMSGNLDF